MSCNVIYEFFSTEPMDNVISSLHHRFDKVVYFGYAGSMLTHQREATQHFLQRVCGVDRVAYVELSGGDLKKCQQTMLETVKAEVASGSRVYFDVTGGDAPIVAMFGRIAERLGVATHFYDIETDTLIEEDKDSPESMYNTVPKQKITLSLDDYFSLYGACIDKRKTKDYKQAVSEEDRRDMEVLFQISIEYKDEWTRLCWLFGHRMLHERTRADYSIDELEVWLKARSCRGLKIDCVDRVLRKLNSQGLLDRFLISGNQCTFIPKNDRIASCLIDAGAVLELHTLFKEEKISNVCEAGVHVDWDGVIEGFNYDVLNEIDVVALRGYIPTFISCKCGNLSREDTAREALYELNTLADRFGGKYAKKKLVITQPLTMAHENRAKEMGIEVEVCE